MAPIGLARDRSRFVKRSSTPAASKTRYRCLPMLRWVRIPALASRLMAVPVLTGALPMRVDADATVTIGAPGRRARSRSAAESERTGPIISRHSCSKVSIWEA